MGLLGRNASCDRNHLQVNTGKTRVGGGFPAQKDPNIHVNINGERVEMVDTCKFLSVHLNNKVDWSDNTDALYRKGQSAVLSEKAQVLQCVHQAVMDVPPVCGGQCHHLCCIVLGRWRWSCGTNKLNKLVKKASSGVVMKLDSVEAVTEKRMRRKLKAI